METRHDSGFAGLLDWKTTQWSNTCKINLLSWKDDGEIKELVPWWIVLRHQENVPGSLEISCAKIPWFIILSCFYISFIGQPSWATLGPWHQGSQGGPRLRWRNMRMWIAATNPAPNPWILADLSPWDAEGWSTACHTSGSAEGYRNLSSSRLGRWFPSLGNTQSKRNSNLTILFNTWFLMFFAFSS